MNFVPWPRERDEWEGGGGGAVQRDVTKELAALFSFAGRRSSRLELWQTSMRA